MLDDAAALAAEEIVYNHLWSASEDSFGKDQRAFLVMDDCFDLETCVSIAKERNPKSLP